MNIYNILLYTVCVLWFAVACMSFIGSTKQTYNFVFNHNSWKLWKYYIKNYDKFEYFRTNNSLFSYKIHVFKLPSTDIEAYIWCHKEGPTCSIHNRDECLLSGFDKYHSKKMSKLLLGKILND